MKQFAWFKGFFGFASVVALTTLSSRASADTALGFDLDYAAPLKADAVSPGWGFGIRLGNQLRAPLVQATPELGFTYHKFGDTMGPTLYRGVAGLRLGVGEVIRPGVFGHVGYGSRQFNSGGQSDSAGSFTYDLGGFLDFTLLPLLNVGVHAAYNQWTGGDSPSFEYATVGGHAALIF